MSLSPLPPSRRASSRRCRQGRTITAGTETFRANEAAGAGLNGMVLPGEHRHPEINGCGTRALARRGALLCRWPREACQPRADLDRISRYFCWWFSWNALERLTVDYELGGARVSQAPTGPWAL